MMIAKAQDKKDIIQACGDAACLLFEYYLSKANMGEFVYTDTKSATALGWKQSKAKKTRLRLTREGWYAQDKFNSPSSGNKMVVDYLGKDTVSEYRLNRALNKAITRSEAIKLIKESGLFKTEYEEKKYLSKLEKSGLLKS